MMLEQEKFISSVYTNCKTKELPDTVSYDNPDLMKRNGKDEENKSIVQCSPLSENEAAIQDSVFRDYRVKMYLNGRHFIYRNGVAGQEHPHTWELSVYMQFPADMFIEFVEFDKKFGKIFDVYQNQTLNYIEPFDKVIPTIENMADYFAEKLNEIILDMGGCLVQLAISETPTHMYVVNINSNTKLKKDFNKYKNAAVQDLVSRKLDSILRNF